VQLPTIRTAFSRICSNSTRDQCLSFNVFCVLQDIVDSLEASWNSQLVIFNSHGGNDFLKPFIREMSGRTKVFICVIDWWRVGKDVYSDIFEKQDDHAGELETSVMLALRPTW